MIYETLLSKPGKKFALLIDPESQSETSLLKTIEAANKTSVNIILIGGSLVSDTFDNHIETIKQHTNIPVLLFPGSLLQLSRKADGILLLSLISGRNPEYLIGNHVIAAPYLKRSNLEVIPTGYILIGETNSSSVEYISNTKPIPASKTDLIVATAIAGELTGNKLIYLEAGSGAKNRISEKIIRAVKNNISIPLVVGGGIRNEEDMYEAYRAGADLVVVSSAVEDDISALYSLAKIALSF
ncbi:MAG: geranylgeranylglyceryl/heptaprenylglyceryl phosphate synthase [Bacteroidales bacterium]|nr:geranylgeranylglyceryl/heptaprenylglyceryl phosphate synthase [Bacteroidales bacterium]